ncbi:hypothetical protein ABD87_15095 [Lysinibacillus sphaericus]|uniref:hypothetical protein n=1 Tax=Lysinibacillus sphaericus TaxID=1421 RepID=UPI0018CFE1F8|nr:hypothetical protein [Lysinibacillus sphaericus]MBG9730815.1 hypothetical protein [Lysinibacillus sphaericus]
MFKRYIEVAHKTEGFIDIYTIQAFTSKQALKKLRNKFNISEKDCNFTFKEMYWHEVQQYYSQNKSRDKVLLHQNHLRNKLNASNSNHPLNTTKLVEHLNNINLENLINIANDLLSEYLRFTRQAFLTGTIEELYIQYLIGSVADYIEELPNAIANTNNFSNLSHKEYLVKEITSSLRDMVNYFDVIKNEVELRNHPDLYRLFSDLEFFFDLIQRENNVV